jgi:5'-nucleotidase
VALILLTNDDGIEAEGLKALEESLQGLAEILVVAPDRERSAVSHGLTIHTPLALNKISSYRYSLNGTPADCVIYALRHVSPQMPDLVVSGINHGANLGDDIMYSGTVAAAREASKNGIPAIAMSQAYDEKPVRFKDAARFARALVRSLLERKERLGVCLNVNVPVRKVRGVKITRQGCSPHYPWFDGNANAQEACAAKPGGPAIPLDFHAILEHYISITPLQRDQTDYDAAGLLTPEVESLSQGIRVPGIGLIGWKN